MQYTIFPPSKPPGDHLREPAAVNHLLHVLQQRQGMFHYIPGSGTIGHIPVCVINGNKTLQFSTESNSQPVSVTRRRPFRDLPDRRFLRGFRLGHFGPHTDDRLPGDNIDLREEEDTEDAP